MRYILLIYEFIKTGLFSVGGGLATMPFLYAMADKYPWFDRGLLLDMIAVSESTPGPIGINMATFAGYTAAGVSGGVIASLALIAPSVAIVSLVGRTLDKFNENRFVKSAFYGLRPAVTALIAWSGMTLAALTLVDLERLPDVLSVFNIKQILLFAVLSALIGLRRKTPPAAVIAAAAVIGAVFKF